MHMVTTRPEPFPMEDAMSRYPFRRKPSRAELSHRFTVTMDFAAAQEDIEVECDYTYLRGEPATGPTWGCAGTPGWGPEIEITEARWKLDHEQWSVCPAWVTDALADDDRIFDLLVMHAEDGE